MNASDPPEANGKRGFLEKSPLLRLNGDLERRLFPFPSGEDGGVSPGGRSLVLVEKNEVGKLSTESALLRLSCRGDDGGVDPGGGKGGGRYESSLLFLLRFFFFVFLGERPRLDFELVSSFAFLRLRPFGDLLVTGIVGSS